MSAKKIINSYINGQFKQMVTQIEEGIEMSTLINYSIEYIGESETLKLLKMYFLVKGQ